MKKLFVLWVQMLDSLRSRILQLLKDDSGEQTISWFGVMVLSIIIVGVVIGLTTTFFPEIWAAIVAKLKSTFQI